MKEIKPPLYKISVWNVQCITGAVYFSEYGGRPCQQRCSAQETSVWGFEDDFVVRGSVALTH